jgi:hypothetical protein
MSKSNLTFALFVFLVCRLKNGAFTIDSSAPTLRGNLNKHPNSNVRGSDTVGILSRLNAMEQMYFVQTFH